MLLRRNVALSCVVFVNVENVSVEQSDDHADQLFEYPYTIWVPKKPKYQVQILLLRQTIQIVFKYGTIRHTLLPDQ